MRVAHFGKYTFVRNGGVERHVAILTRELASRGIDVTVFSYDPEGTLRPGNVDGVHFEPIPTLVNVGSQSIAPRLLHRFRHHDQPKPFDIIHQHWPDPFAHLVATVIGRRPAQVVTWHSDIVRQRFIAPLYRGLARAALVKPDALIGATNSHLSSPQVDCFIDRRRRHVIPYSIDARPFRTTPQLLNAAQTLRARYDNRPLVFALGRHVYYKGFEFLLEAMQELPAILLLGGTGPLTPTLKRKAADLNITVDFLGEIPEQLLPTYYHASSVFCLPSVAQTEAFGLVQAEAMASAKPIVNTNLRNGVNELAPNGICALTVEPQSSVQLHNALQTIITNPQLAIKLGNTGCNRIAENYSIDLMLEKTIELYEQLIAVRRK